MNSNKKGISKKFVLALVVALGAVFLLIFGKLSELYFTIIELANIFLYQFVEGKLDLADLDIKRLELGPVKIEGGNNEEDNTEG